ncbi:MAG: hypothetical protein KC589_04860 [Nanoarchaeota archaeon]|nr:hypothetical protein [Nanoarchaeota archaeon]
MKKIKRVKTYIKGFDELIQGGFPQGSNILLKGNPGTGKTIMSLNYLYNGAVNDGDVGVYFTFEERRESLITQANLFGWDLEKLEKKGKIKIVSLGIDDIDKNTVKDILDIIKNLKAKRVIIDSITTLSFLSPSCMEGKNFGIFDVKKFVYTFLTSFSNIDEVTTLFISQKENLKESTVAEYFCDGVVQIEYESMGGDFSRNLTINKMRKTKNDEDLHPLEICDEGIIVHNLE